MDDDVRGERIRGIDAIITTAGKEGATFQPCPLTLRAITPSNPNLTAGCEVAYFGKPRCQFSQILGVWIGYTGLPGRPRREPATFHQWQGQGPNRERNTSAHSGEGSLQSIDSGGGCSRGLPFWSCLFSKKFSDAPIGIAGHLEAYETASEQAARFEILDRPVAEARGLDQFSAGPAQSWFFACVSHSLVASFAGVCEPDVLRPVESPKGG
jgi:hypothetical protein